jgi:hypothetical protein
MIGVSICADLRHLAIMSRQMVTVNPAPLAWNTIGLDPFCCGGKYLASRSDACWLCLPGQRLVVAGQAAEAQQPDRAAAS